MEEARKAAEKISEDSLKEAEEHGISTPYSYALGCMESAYAHLLNDYNNLKQQLEC